ncbi:MAG: 50S ribosomal protein L19 [Chlamydiae bacterium]|nr:50S ribosomal protein L19 [Chlamydiota bacterium]
MNRMIKEELEKEQLKEEVPEFCVGDTLRISTRIIEGEKERVQVVQGTVIARKGSGLSETFSIHRISYGEGMERVFYLHSPRISNIEVVKRGDVRRAKLYYLRGTSGKAAKVKEKMGKRVKNKAPVAKKKLKSESETSVTEKSAPEVVENGASA